MNGDYIAVAVGLISIFAFFSWGFIGVFFANSIRLLVGNGYQLFSVILCIYAIRYLLKKTLRLSLSRKQFIAVTLFLVSSLVALTLLAYPNETQLLSQIWQAIFADLFSNQLLRNVGGGLIGASLTNGLLFLFGQIGTVILLVIAFVVVVFLLSGQTFDDIRQTFTNMQKNKQQRQKKKDVTLQPSSENVPKLLDKMKQGIQEMLGNDDEVDTTNEEILDKQTPVYHTDSKPFVINAFQQDNELSANKRMETDIDANQVDSTNVSSQQIELEADDVKDVQFNQGEVNEHYILPPVTLLRKVESVDQSAEYDLIKRNSRILEETFKSFGVNARVISANLGPSVTKFEVQPAVGVKVSKIVNLADDLALALAAKDIRIEAPIPGKSYVGIEVPNQTTSTVSFREIIEGNISSKSKLEVPLGRDISGNIRIADLSKMPHLLVAGATGSGKSVAINGMITSILMKAKPNEVKLMMIDPKKVELNVYNGIPHLLTPVVTNPRRAAQALQKVVAEMEKRYELFAETGMRNITGYNEQVEEYNKTSEDKMIPMPYIVVIVDELADLMMVASNEVENAIIRLAQMARAAGIHMVLATQRPSVDVITGLIKANVPSRMAFAVSSSIDSRTIIDSNGAEKLLGKGDMLFMPMGENKPIRVQGAFLSDDEVEKIVDFVKDQQEANYNEDMMPSDEEANQTSGEVEDELFHEVVAFLADQDYISVSMLQRRFRIGFNRAARLMEDLEAKGIVGAPEGTKPRRVLLGENEQ